MHQCRPTRYLCKLNEPHRSVPEVPSLHVRGSLTMCVLCPAFTEESAASICLQQADDGVDEAVDDAVAAAEALNWQELQLQASPASHHVGAPSPRYTVDENGVLTYEYDLAYIAQKYEIFDMRIYHRLVDEQFLFSKG